MSCDVKFKFYLNCPRIHIAKCIIACTSVILLDNHIKNNYPNDFVDITRGAQENMISPYLSAASFILSLDNFVLL